MIQHNKKQNVGIIFELLNHQIVSGILEKNSQQTNNSLSLIRKYFRNGTALSESLKIYSVFLESETDKWQTASRILSESLERYKNIDQSKLKNELYHLLKEIHGVFGKEFFKQKVDNYKLYASVYALLNEAKLTYDDGYRDGQKDRKLGHKSETAYSSQHQDYAIGYHEGWNNLPKNPIQKTKKLEITEKVMPEESIISHLMDSKVYYEKPKDQEMDCMTCNHLYHEKKCLAPGCNCTTDNPSLEEVDEETTQVCTNCGHPTREHHHQTGSNKPVCEHDSCMCMKLELNEQLVEHFVLKRFNSTYSKILTTTQKEVLSEYISNPKFDSYVEKAKKKIETILYEQLKKSTDKNLSNKLFTSMQKLDSLTDMKDTNKKLEMLLEFSCLVDEFAKLSSEKVVV